jgi:hypothetical protein
MSDSKELAKPYGARFAEAWKLLQVYLADLDPSELSAMEKMDSEATLSLLHKQPALGTSGALQDAGNTGPEEFAIAIMRERLDILERAVKPGGSALWGARFMQAWRDQGMPLSAFNYGLIQSIKQAEKDQTIKILRKNVQALGSGNSAFWDTKNPERLAEKLGNAWRMRQMAIAMTFMAVT